MIERRATWQPEEEGEGGRRETGRDRQRDRQHAERLKLKQQTESLRTKEDSCRTEKGKDRQRMAESERERHAERRARCSGRHSGADTAGRTQRGQAERLCARRTACRGTQPLGPPPARPAPNTAPGLLSRLLRRLESHPRSALSARSQNRLRHAVPKAAAAARRSALRCIRPGLCVCLSAITSSSASDCVQGRRPLSSALRRISRHPPCPLAIMSGDHVWRLCLAVLSDLDGLEMPVERGDVERLLPPPGTQSQRTDARETPRVVC